MKAYAALGDGVDRLRLIERPAPKPKANEISVKMTAASPNCRD